MSAAANIAELRRPCEIIIAIAPNKPQFIPDMIPATTNLMCPTEE